MDHDFAFSSLLLITGLAALLSILTPVFRRLRLPLIVVEIFAGIVVGRSAFNLIEVGPSVDFLATFGFTYLMFLSGLEMDYGELSLTSDEKARQGRFGTPLGLGVLMFVCTLGVAILAAYGLFWLELTGHPFFIGLILSTTSLGIVVPILKERGLTATRYGQTLLASAVVADFGTMLLITVAAAAVSRGLTLDLLLIFVLLVVFALAVRLGRLATGLQNLERWIDELSHSTAQIRVRATFALMIGFIVLSKWLGTEVILGAFLGGTVIALLPSHEGSLLRVKMEAIGYGFFIPVFFIMVGVRFDLPSLLNSSEAILLVPLLLVIACLVKGLPALLYLRHFSRRETLGAGMLLSARLSLIIAAASIALELGVIDQATNTAMVLLAIITCTLAPILFNYTLPPQETPVRRGLILVGLGQLPTLLAERLRQTGEEATLVGTDPGRALEVEKRGFRVVIGNPVVADVLREAGASTAATLVALSSPDETNRAVCWLAREQFAIPHLIALASDPVVAAVMSEQGIRVIQPQLATVLAIEGALHFPATFDMLTDPADGVSVREATLTNHALVGRPLRQLRLPGGALVLGLRRHGEALVPRGETVLHWGDILMLVSDTTGVDEAIAWLNPAHAGDI